jgi:hypothetical protein
VRELRRWFLPRVWELGEARTAGESPLERRVELRLAEYMNDHWTEDDLRMIFGELLPRTGNLSVDLVLAYSGASQSSAARLVGHPGDLLRTS